MNTYHPAQPRIAFAVAAVAAAALTLGALIVLPVQIESSDETMPVALAAEPHVDSSRVALAIQDRERRHDLVARAIGAVERGARIRLAGAPVITTPLITAPQETRQ